jgi:hypothetical protein
LDKNSFWYIEMYPTPDASKMRTVMQESIGPDETQRTMTMDDDNSALVRTPFALLLLLLPILLFSGHMRLREAEAQAPSHRRNEMLPGVAPYGSTV